MEESGSSKLEELAQKGELPEWHEVHERMEERVDWKAFPILSKVWGVDKEDGG